MVKDFAYVPNATGLGSGTTTITATATISGTQYQGTAPLTVQ